MHLLSTAIRHRVTDKAESSKVNDVEKRGQTQRACHLHPHILSEPPRLELADQLHRLHVPMPDCADPAAYRTLPILSGILIPFSIMLSIPSLTGHWYVRTGDDHSLLEVRRNPVLLDVAMAFSMACGVLANICLVIRFSERRIKLMTVLCITFLSLHDIINIPAVTIFGVIHRYDDGFTYGQSFWLTVCSTIFSTTTNFTLIYDYSRTEDFKHSGSGLTHKQRALLIILIILLCYVSLGSVLLAVTLDITFLDGLYLAVVSIETIGFGDLHPISTGTRVLACVYISVGIINLALLVALSREALLEAASEGVQARMKAARAHARERSIRTRWRAAVHWRLKAQGLPTWVDDRDEERQGRINRNRHRHWYSWIRHVWRRAKGETWREWEDPAWKYVYGPGHKRLNLRALSDRQLETAALEAGLPLSELIPHDLGALNEGGSDAGLVGHPPMSWRHPFMAASADPGMHPPSLTNVRVGGMVSLLGNFALAVSHGSHGYEPESPDGTMDSDGTVTETDGLFKARAVTFNRTLTSMTLGEDDEGHYVPESLEIVERHAFYTRLSLSLSLFFIFWMAGSAIFMKTEGWGFGSSMYFCFISFSTVGYGDLAPRTPAGRSIFIVWALLGVGTMTILISILAEAYSSSYKSVIKSETLVSTAHDCSLDREKHTAHHPGGHLGLHTMSLPPGDGGLHSGSSSTVVGDQLTPLFSSTLASTSPQPARKRRATLALATLPEDSQPPSQIKRAGRELPLDVLRRVDHMMSIIAMRERQPQVSVTGSNGYGSLSGRTTEALLKEIEENLVVLAKASKEALETLDAQSFGTSHV